MNADAAFDLFLHASAAGRLAQGYVIAGAPRGGAGDFVAKALQLLFCEAENKPCGECQGCKGAVEHTHPDLAWVEPQKKSRLISVGQVREFQRRIYQTSFSGGWKVCVIVGADRLGVEASNAFLKVLEEPPGQSLFFLLTDSPQFLLATINSRCQHIQVAGDALDLPEEWASALFSILQDCHRGNPIQAFALSDRFRNLLRLVKEAAASEVADDADAESVEEDSSTLDARASARYRESRSALIRMMLWWYRDILLLVCKGDEALVRNSQHLELIKEKAAGLSYRNAMRNVDIVERLNRQMERNLPEGPLLSAAFGYLA